MHLPSPSLPPVYLPARSLNLKQCKRVGDAGLAALAPRLQHLTSLYLQVCGDMNGLGCMQGLRALPRPWHPVALRFTLTPSAHALHSPALSLCPQGMGELTDAGVAQLAQLRRLADLELQFAWQFGDAGIAALTALTGLSRLDLMYRWVGDPLMYRDACHDGAGGWP